MLYPVSCIFVHASCTTTISNQLLSGRSFLFYILIMGTYLYMPVGNSDYIYHSLCGYFYIGLVTFRHCHGVIPTQLSFCSFVYYLLISGGTGMYNAGLMLQGRCKLVANNEKLVRHTRTGAAIACLQASRLRARVTNQLVDLILSLLAIQMTLISRIVSASFEGFSSTDLRLSVTLFGL